MKTSSTLMSALAGALFVGIANAALFALAIGPTGGIPFGFAEVALSFLAGAVFGTIAGGVAGASEVETAAAVEPSTSQVRPSVARAA